MGANTAFSLFAAAGSLLITVASGVKGRWEVAIVFGLLVIGFLFRAGEHWRERRRERRAAPPPSAAPARRVKAARFRRR
ncbi:MAG TPA: hypothetical protein VGD00_05535 [Solirubrobacteraceae bacterium]|jgi:hypothetical protein